MCGIAGILNLKHDVVPSKTELKAMVSQMHHRGPDGTGFYTDHHIGLGHARLSIIDLDSGDQPIHNEDKSLWTVFNGEIFNYIELRELLLAKGHRFYTQSDTEVIVHLYEEFGADFVNHLNGQFAIALWDTRSKKLLLYRDRPGICPLFYTQKKGRLLFGSEIKAILPALGEAPTLCPAALDQLMTFWAPVSPNTVFKDIFEVSPGELIEIKDGQISKRKYWDWSFSDSTQYFTEPEEQLTEELNALLIDATKLRLRSDVPVGAYLSGGLDSSILTSLIHNYGNVPLRTFSIGFDDKGFDETSYQQKVIDHLHADHSLVHCTLNNIADNFVSAIWHTESPILRTAPVPMKILSALAHEHNFKVVLTGEGADEVLGGYDIFKEAKIRQFWAKHPDSTLRPLLLKRLYPYLDISQKQGLIYLQKFFGVGLDQPNIPYFSHMPRFVTTAKCKTFFSNDLKAQLNGTTVDSLSHLFPPSFGEWHPFNRSQYLEFKSLMPGYLLCSQGDRMLLSNSVEGRFPFLDHRVIEFAARLHPKLKMKVLNEKYLLKRVAKKYLPKEIIGRHKQPYRAPDIAAFYNQGKMSDFASELLDEKKLASYGYFDPKRVKMLRKKIVNGRATGYKDNMSFVGMLSTQVWHHHFVENYRHNFL